jgi:hypothetical protein
VENIMIDAAVVAYAAPALTHVSAPALEVRVRAVTLRGAGGQVCPQTGWPISGSPMFAGQRTSLSAGTFGATTTDPRITSGMDDTRTGKPCTGSYAFSGTG